MKSKGFFITGTDTDVGKTFVSAILLALLRQKGINVGYFKPIQSGGQEISGKLFSPDVQFVRRLNKIDDPDELINPYCLKAALAPKEAAKLENLIIEVQKIQAAYDSLHEKYDFLIVEGAGGVKVPLWHDVWVDDYIKQLDLPVIIVARPVLGTINHTLLTIDCLKAKNVDIAGFIFNFYPLSNAEFAKRNAEIISAKSDVKYLGFIPQVSPEILQKKAAKHHLEFIESGLINLKELILNY